MWLVENRNQQLDHKSMFYGGHVGGESKNHPYTCRIKKEKWKESATGATREKRRAVAKLGEKMKLRPNHFIFKPIKSTL